MRLSLRCMFVKVNSCRLLCLYCCKCFLHIIKRQYYLKTIKEKCNARAPSAMYKGRKIWRVSRKWIHQDRAVLPWNIIQVWCVLNLVWYHFKNKDLFMAQCDRCEKWIHRKCEDIPDFLRRNCVVLGIVLAALNIILINLRRVYIIVQF